MGKWARFLICIGLILIMLALGFSISSAGVFFSVNFGDGVMNYNTITSDQVKKNQAIEGYVYGVYDCIAEGYTETTSNGQTVSTTTDSYYYLIPLDDVGVEVILIEVPAGEEIVDKMDALCQASWGGEDPDNLLDNGIAISGVVEKNDEELEDLFDEWCEEYEFDDLVLSPYNINCTTDYHSRCSMFLISLIFYAAFIIYVIIIIRVIFKKRRASQPVGGYTGMGTYQDAANTEFYGSGSAANGAYQQGGNYGSTDTYQSNINTADNFQTQNQMQYQPQNNGIDNGYGSQSADAVPTYNSGTSTSDSSSFGYGNSYGPGSNSDNQ